MRVGECVCVGARMRVWVCLRACSLINPACNAPPCCQLQPLAPPYLSTLPHKWHDFRKKVTELKTSILIFSTTFIWNTSHSKKNSARYCHKCENVFMQSTRHFCRIWIKLEFSRKNLKYQISSKSVQWEPSCSMRADRRTVGHNEANSHFSQLCERA